MIAAQSAAVGFLSTVLWIYWLILIARVLSSWLPPPTSPAARTILRLLHAVTDPILRPLRQMIPPVRVGGAALDLSPIILFVIIGAVLGALR